MILALLNGRPASGKTTLALHLAAAWAARRERVVVVDASPALDALRWHEKRLRAGLPSHFRVLPAVPKRLDRRSLSRLARRAHVVVDGPSGASALSLPALLASDLAIIPTGPSPADTKATLEMVGLALDTRAVRHAAQVRFLFNQRLPSSEPSRDVAEMRTEYEPALLDAMVGHHELFAEAAFSGHLVHEFAAGAPAGRELATLADEILCLPLPRCADRRGDGLLTRLLAPWMRPDTADGQRSDRFSQKDDTADATPISNGGQRP